MMQFYDTYKDNEIVSTLLSQISWSNNLLILISEYSSEIIDKKLLDNRLNEIREILENNKE